MPCVIGKALLVSKRDNYLFPLKIKDALPMLADDCPVIHAIKDGLRRIEIPLPRGIVVKNNMIFNHD